jgi:hypothetical protein
MHKAFLISTTMLTSVAFCAGPRAAFAQQAASPVSWTSQGPAVDGVNLKVGGFGGSFANQSIAGAQGSITAPLGQQFGFQLDGTRGNLSGNQFVDVGGHLFWRNPATGLLGVWASYTELMTNPHEVVRLEC